MAPNDSAYQLYSVEDLLLLKADPSKWIIPDMIPRIGRVLIYGKGSVYKSAFMFDTSIAVASGGLLLETLPVVRSFGPVLLLSCEGSIYNNRDRLLAHMRSRNVHPTAVRLFYGQQALELRRAEGINILAAMVEQIRPRMVVLDPLVSFYGGNENDSEQMGSFTRGLDVLIQRYEFALVILHHANKAADLRGSTVLQAWADGVVKLELAREQQVPSFPDKKDIITANVEKQRDGRTGKLFSAVPIFDDKLQMITFGIYDSPDAQGVIVAHLRNEVLKLFKTSMATMTKDQIAMAFPTYSRGRISEAVDWLERSKLLERYAGAGKNIWRITAIGSNVDAARAILRAITSSEEAPDADVAELG